MSEGTKKKANRKTGPKPIFTIIKIGEEGNVELLELTRNASTAMKTLAANPGAEVLEKELAA
jgi:hypothetical protein